MDMYTALMTKLQNISYRVGVGECGSVKVKMSTMYI